MCTVRAAAVTVVANDNSPNGAPVMVFSGTRHVLLSVGAFSCVINLLMLTGPLFMLQIYDRVLASRSVPTLLALVILVAGLYGALSVLELIRSRVLVRVGRKMDEHLRDDVFQAVIGHEVRMTPGIGSRPLRDLDTVRQFASGPGPFAFFDMPWLPIYLGVIFMLHTLLGLFAVAAALILVVMALANEVLTHGPLTRANQVSEDAHAFAEDGRRAADTARALGMHEELGRLWQARKAEALKLQAAASDRAGILSSVSKGLRLLFQSGILGLGAWLAIRQEVTPGTMIAASIIMGRALAPVDQAIAHWRAFVAARDGYRRLKTLLAEPARDLRPTQLPKPKGTLSVKGLSAFAPNVEQPIIFNINFEIAAGEGLGIIGPSGAGKTTLAKALLGIWPLTRGEVRLDGATLDQWDSVTLGAHLGYLPQEATLFPGTIAQNISRYQPEPDSDDILAAARLAGVHDLVLSLPDGYETVVGSGRNNLSAGQRQRVALARALYGEPSLVVLDEPNSNLDAEGDAALTRAIRSVRDRGATAIIIAHRPSAISAVDTLLFLRAGQMEAFGPKDDVLNKVVQPVQHKRAG